MIVPRIEEMPWLTTESQEEVGRLYQMYRDANKYLIPLHELTVGRYTMVYITDSGVSAVLISLFSRACNRRVLASGDMLFFQVEYMERATTCATIRIIGPELSTFHYDWGNYGKSWRLTPVYEDHRREEDSSKVLKAATDLLIDLDT